MRNLIYLGALMVLFASCEKSEPTEVVETKDSTNYFPMEIGNYWVYEVYEVDTLGNEENLGVLDSIVIVGDTVINNKNYFVFHGPVEYFRSFDTVQFLRDSMGFVVNSCGTIKMAPEDVENPIWSYNIPSEGTTLFNISYSLEKNNDILILPAGAYEVINYKGTVNMLVDGHFSHLYPRYIHNYYADGIGLIMKTRFFALFPKHFEERLIRYHIN